MTTDVPALLGAASGAIPTLLLALVFQRPLLLGLVRVADMYREGLARLEANKVARWLLWLTPGFTGGITRNVDYTVIAFGVLGMISSVALQGVPATAWTDGGSWSGLSDLVFWTHLGVVAMLALTVGAGLIVIASGARTDSGVGEPK